MNKALMDTGLLTPDKYVFGMGKWHVFLLGYSRTLSLVA